MADAVVEEQRAPGYRSRAEEVMDIERGLIDLYRDATLDRKPDLLERRGGAFYSEAAAQLVASLHEGTGAIQAVDVRDDGKVADLAGETVVEVRAPDPAG